MNERVPSLHEQLIGTDEATIDDKGRLLVSQKKRTRLGSPFAMTIEPLGCIGAYPMAIWNQKIAEILSYPSINQGRQEFQALTAGDADDELKFDKQGRVVVPQKLRLLAKIKEKVIVKGCFDHLEIWSEEEYKNWEKDRAGYRRAEREAVQRAYDRMIGKE